MFSALLYVFEDGMFKLCGEDTTIAEHVNNVIRIVLDVDHADGFATRGHFSRMLSALQWRQLRQETLPLADSDSSDSFGDLESSTSSHSESRSEDDYSLPWSAPRIPSVAEMIDVEQSEPLLCVPRAPQRTSSCCPDNQESSAVTAEDDVLADNDDDNR